jgi:hypothetical protein
MRAFNYLAIALLVVVGCGVAAEAPSSRHAPRAAAVVALERSGRAVRLAATGPCPTSLRGFGDVANAEDDLGHELLPAAPRFGVVCWYGTSASLVSTSLVDGRSAAALGAAIDALSTKVPQGVTNCPAAFASAAVLALALPHGVVVDLWYDDTGCQSLDNGYLRAYETGNPAFYERFIPLATGLRPAAGMGGG